MQLYLFTISWCKIIRFQQKKTGKEEDKVNQSLSHFLLSPTYFLLFYLKRKSYIDYRSRKIGISKGLILESHKKIWWIIIPWMKQLHIQKPRPVTGAVSFPCAVLLLDLHHLPVAKKFMIYERYNFNENSTWLKK